MYKKILLLSFLVSSHALVAIAAVLPSYVDYKVIMDELYKDISDATISQEERTQVQKTGGSPVYGEIIFDSVALLLKELNLREDDVFYDLGSGIGKFVTQVYLTTPVHKSVGIEFSPSRYEQSVKVEDRVKKIYQLTSDFENDLVDVLAPGNQSKKSKKMRKKNNPKTFAFYNMDMMKADIADATVIFTCSTCFSQEFMEKLANKFATETKTGTKILSLRPLPTHKQIKLVKTFNLPMTWSQKTDVNYYVVENKPADTNNVSN